MATEIPEKNDWDLTNPPPEGHADVAAWAWVLFETARLERDRLGLPERWIANYKLFRGDHWGKTRTIRDRNKLAINLYFANVQRTVANITARNPVAEVVDMDGYGDEADLLLTSKLKKWWKDSKQRPKLRTTSQKMEKYGITIEKTFWDSRRKMPDTTIVDPFAFFPCPGYFEDIPAECPYVAHAYPDSVEAIEQMFDKSGVEIDNVYSLLGEDREENRPIPAGTRRGSQNAEGNYTSTMHPSKKDADVRGKRALVVEVWVRDYSTRTLKEASIDPETGEEIKVETEIPKYPGGIRVITVTNQGRLLLDDKANPNVNPALPPELAAGTYLFDRFPFHVANSYTDTTSIWGFSAAEQVADLNHKIDEIVSRIVAYVMRSMNPTLIIPKGCGVERWHINNKPGLVLFPLPDMAPLIRYLPVPNLPSDFFNTLELLINFFDRTYQIEDADRGIGPKGVVAASAIVALQERNAVLIQHKINSVDYLVEQRGRCAISFFQNFSVMPEAVEVQGDTREFQGVKLAGRKFNYVVESGSTMPKTSLQTEEQAKELYREGVIDRQAVLETLNFPGWKEIIERVGEGQLDQALQVLVQAGLPEEGAMQLKQTLMQPQGGPGNRPQNPKQPQAGTPKAMQGARA